MAKAYWISQYRKIHDTEKLAAYGKLAGPALRGAGGRFLVRADHAIAFDDGIDGRTVVIEFDSVDAALAAHESPAYQEALRALGDGVERDMRIVEGIDDAH